MTGIPDNPSESFKRRNPHLYPPNLRQNRSEIHQNESDYTKTPSKPSERGKNQFRPWAQSEIDVVRAACGGGQPVDISVLANGLNRSYAAVALKISRLGLGDWHRKSTERALANMRKAKRAEWESLPSDERNRRIARIVSHSGTSFAGHKHTEEYKAKASKRSAELWKSKPHPRGMLGKKHTEETKAIISRFHKGTKVPRERIIRARKTRLARYGTFLSQRPSASWKAQWVEVGGKRFYARSLWEANYARYLQFLKERTGEVKEWDHEPETFWFDGLKRGCVSYLPDFKVLRWDGTYEYHEVKGWMDARSVTKIKRMAKYFPQVKLVVIDSARYKALSIQCRKLVPNWDVSTAKEGP